MGIIKRAPTSLLITMVIVGGLTGAGVFAGFVALELAGEDTADYQAFTTTVLNLAMFALTGTSTVGAVLASRSASAVERGKDGK